MDLKEIFENSKDLVNKEVELNGWIRNHRRQKEFGFIECTLSEDYLKLFVMDDNSNVLVNDVEIDNVEYNSIDFIIEYFWRVVSGEIKNIWDLMNTTYDKFVRTTDKQHEKVVQHI